MRILTLSAIIFNFLILGASLFANAQVRTEPTCWPEKYIRQDIEKMNRNDRILIERFRELNPKLIQAMINEVNDAVTITYLALLKQPHISSLAKQFRENPVNRTLARRFQYEIMRAVPRALHIRDFRSQNNQCIIPYNGCIPGFSSLIFDDEFLNQQVLTGQDGSGLYYSTVRRLDSKFFGNPLIKMPRNSLSGLIVNGDFTFDSEDYRNDRRPTEIEFFYTYRPMDEETTLPSTRVNDYLEVANIKYRTEYYTPALMLDVETGFIRHVAIPRKGLVPLDQARPDLGAARIVSSYMHQRWQLELSLEKIKADKVCP